MIPDADKLMEPFVGPLTLCENKEHRCRRRHSDHHSCRSKDDLGAILRYGARNHRRARPRETGVVNSLDDRQQYRVITGGV